MEKKIRNSNIEFLRIISMIMIISHHLAIHSTINFTSGFSLNKFSIQVLLSLGKIGVNIFFIISGYYLIEKKELSLKKIKSIWLSVLFYSISISVAMYFFSKPIRLKELVTSVFPISTSMYWFATVYIILLIFSPYINSLLNNFEKQDYFKFLFLMFTIFIFIPTFTRNIIVINYLIIALFSYSLGGFLRKFKIQEKEKKLIKLVGLLSTMVLIVSIVVLELMSSKFLFLNGKEANIFSSSQSFIMMSIAFFIFFIVLEEKSRSNYIVDTIATTTFGVYLIHDHPLVREQLWKDVNLQSKYTLSYFPLYCFLIVIVIFIISSLIEFFRLNIVKNIKKKL